MSKVNDELDARFTDALKDREPDEQMEVVNILIEDLKHSSENARQFVAWKERVADGTWTSGDKPEYLNK